MPKYFQFDFDWPLGMLKKNLMLFNIVQAVQEKNGEFDTCLYFETGDERILIFALEPRSPGDSCTTHSCATEDIKESFIVQAQEQRIELLEISEHLDITQARHRLHSRGSETYSSVDVQFVATI
ncbi:CWF19-like protein 1 isoform X3 [Caretta caretta]|uniref:CWF19-like protein 1 isoform X3 n=1 Tax=Caretta caretta TaxID=8467 RepID=UPI003F4BBA53